ncbi:MAG: hypothetical protein AAFY22_12740 [Pseudomonadota bacterium]
MLKAIAAVSVLAVAMAPVSVRAADNTIKDLQVGERGLLMRVALFCDTPCAAAVTRDGFKIADVVTRTEVPLKGRSTLADVIRFTPVEGATVMTILGPRAIENAAVRPCDINGDKATCVDVKFAESPIKPAAASRAQAAPVAPPSLKPQRRAASRAGAPAIAPPQGLRAAPGRDLLTFGRFAPPARLGAPQAASQSGPSILSVPEPPLSASAKAAQAAAQKRERERRAAQRLAAEKKAVADRLAQQQQAEERRARQASAANAAGGQARLGEPALILPPRGGATTPGAGSAYGRRGATPPSAASLGGAPILKGLSANFVFRERVADILGREFGAAQCEAARSRLDADAWALDAMVNVGLCMAADGEAAEADALLARLLSYTPDNYEALVGRALIAAEAGETGAAKRYFQEALNALPPIEESNRILFAMRSLG